MPPSTAPTARPALSGAPGGTSAAPAAAGASATSGPVVLLAVLGLALWAALWQLGHPVGGAVVAAGLGAGVLRNAAHLAALPWRHAHLLEFVDAWEARTGVDFGRGERSDDVARALHREWRRAHRHLSARQFLSVRAAD